MHDIEHYLFHTPIWLIVDIGINKFVLLNLNCLVSCPSLCDGNLTSLPLQPLQLKASECVIKPLLPLDYGTDDILALCCLFTQWCLWDSRQAFTLIVVYGLYYSH